MSEQPASWSDFIFSVGDQPIPLSPVPESVFSVGGEHAVTVDVKGSFFQERGIMADQLAKATLDAGPHSFDVAKVTDRPDGAFRLHLDMKRKD